MERAPHVPEWTAQELARRIEDNEEVHILDVRAPFRLESGCIDIVPLNHFHNVPGSELMRLEDPVEAGLPRTATIAVVCGRGNDSRAIAGHLHAHGLRSVSLTGGMVAWMALTVPRVLEAPPGCESLLQFDRVGKGALAYAVVSDGEALIVDPPRHTGALLESIRAGNACVIGVAETHAHADYISGGSDLARELDVPYYLHPEDAFYPYDGTPGSIRFEAIEDEREIPVGRVRLRVVHTPGHTDGSVSYRIGDHAVLTGDFLFVDSIGRPDLGGKAEPWARTLWQSVERARSEWPRGVRIYPAHYASPSERNRDLTVGKSFGELEESNVPLGIDSEEAFLEWVLSKTGSFPEAYRRIKAINVGLDHPSEAEMDELEAGRNQCALS
jgi:glyoxylase-like metal-dependent hydrolase (beta-lactamase superfamily II)